MGRRRTQRVQEYLEHRSEEQYGAWIGDLAAHGLGDDQVDGGEGRVPARLRRAGDRARRRPRHPPRGVVSRVEWGAVGVSVTTSASTLTASSAVVTVPVGVLQSDDFDISPALPPDVAGPLSRLRMNAFEKVFLRFDQRFWDTDVLRHPAAGRGGPLVALLVRPHGPG
ncbi:MAG: FAD-dependent oxidoreductase [Microbacterium sp.]